MTAMIEVDPMIRIRVLEMHAARLAAENESLLIRCAELIDDRNRLIADRERMSQANGALLARIDSITGYPHRLLLPYHSTSC